MLRLRPPLKRRVEVAVVVAGDDNFVFVGEGVKPVEGFLEGFDRPVVGEVAGVEEQVAGGDGGDVGRRVGMRVADADDADGRPVLPLSAGFVGDDGRDDPDGRPWNARRGGPANGVVDTVEPDYDCQWGLDEAFEKGGGVPFRLSE
ncbi:hypothetical protein V492_03802 [Pseudogymnoascus sp. VKM F-4246]|nr:hypothetical protein V492_03802 [Pseudogymnoascus sp. VKM F-4246]